MAYFSPTMAAKRASNAGSGLAVGFAEVLVSMGRTRLLIKGVDRANVDVVRPGDGLKIFTIVTRGEQLSRGSFVVSRSLNAALGNRTENVYLFGFVLPKTDLLLLK